VNGKAEGLLLKLIGKERSSWWRVPQNPQQKQQDTLSIKYERAELPQHLTAIKDRT